jgi:heterodisulfide reductase subunit A
LPRQKFLTRKGVRDFFVRLPEPETEIMNRQTHDTVGAVMVVGGGIAGMQAALDLAATGYYVYLVEASPAIGGTMAQLDKTFPTNECAM